ncbi:MAG: flippase-like domain-containing protein, partial [Clostridia bacterium]|nr:flippase-like domain-containing protein [Clostridia bacterium]
VHVTCYYVILGEEGKRIPALSLFKICFSGFALNSVTPAGLVGGEPYRIMALKKYCSTEKASSATLTFSLFYIMGHISIWFSGSIVYFATGSFGETAIDILIILTVIVTAIILAVFFLSKRRGLVRSFMAFLTKVPLIKKQFKRTYEKNEQSYCEIDENIRDFRATRKQFWTVFFLQYLSRVLECVEYFLIFYFLGVHINIFGGVLILTMASLIGNLIVFIPMQTGSRELGTYTALAALNIDPQIGAMGLIIYRVRDFICIILGVLLIMFDKKKNKSE